MQPTRQRVRLPVLGAVAQVPIKLDHASHMALMWSAKVLKAGPLRLDPTFSGVVRRALHLYAEHLEGLDPAGHQEEAHEVQHRASALVPNEEARAAALARLEADPMPARLVDVLLSKETQKANAALLDKVDAMVADINAAKVQAMNAAKRAKKAATEGTT